MIIRDSDNSPIGFVGNVFSNTEHHVLRRFAPSYPQPLQRGSAAPARSRAAAWWSRRRVRDRASSVAAFGVRWLAVRPRRRLLLAGAVGARPGFSPLRAARHARSVVSPAPWVWPAAPVGRPAPSSSAPAENSGLAFPPRVACAAPPARLLVRDLSALPWPLFLARGRRGPRVVFFGGLPLLPGLPRCSSRPVGVDPGPRCAI